MAFCRVYSTAIIVLLCTTICFSYGCRTSSSINNCDTPRRIMPHGERAIFEACKIYECDNGQWIFKYQTCRFNKKCYWVTTVLTRNHGVKWECTKVTNTKRDWKKI
ncbi:hypothetical protein PoB_002277300 [Plakobranchus ocellatus]|uniref:Uncharacterized protein n=1 Tax=Plakobranchus ocellatus TaxID=259542 RepID=A0AAV3ZNV1_9GAST|nr:hypothetical protein PoB_002277300 [Plakobranchus ocellatus]